MRYYRKFLSKLESASTNLEMIKMCEEAGLVLLGTGSARVVYALTEKLVVKIARNPVGKKQNDIEAQIWNYLDYDRPGLKQYFAKVHINLQPVNDMFLVMERLNKATKGSRVYTSATTFVSRGWKHKVTDKRALSFAEAIHHVDLTLDTMTANDIRSYNLGSTLDGKIKVLDYGLNRYTWNTQYKTDPKLARSLSTINN